MQAPKKTATIKDALRAKAGVGIEPAAPVAIDKRAVEEGRKPLPAAQKDAAAVPSIDGSFKFSPLPSDEEFNYLHVEPLLDQAADLLERCMAEKAQHDLLQIEKWKLERELDQLSRFNQIEERERQAGLDARNPP